MYELYLKGILKYFGKLLILFQLVVTISIISCKKEEVPVLTTVEITNITGTSVTSGGIITDKGSGTIIARGVCWSPDITPTLADDKTSDGAGAGSFVSNLTGLTPGKTYYVRGYATDSAGTSYGNELSFTTSAVIPILTTIAITSITTTTACSGGNITSDGGATISVRGVCWSTSQSPTIVDNNTSDGSGIGTFSSSITNLSSNITYYIRAYATNTSGTGYGQEVSFKTLVLSDIVGNIYNTITIGTQIWMKENLRTTKYNDATTIPLVTGNTEWSILTTPGYCWYNNNEAGYNYRGNIQLVSCEHRKIVPCWLACTF